MTIEVFKKQVVAAVAPLEATVGKRGDYGRVQVNLPNGNEIAGFFRLESEVAFNDIAAQAQAAGKETCENTLFVFKGAEIPERAFGRPNDSNYTPQSSCEHVVIPRGVTVIGPQAFWRCNIKEIVIPEGVTEICDRAFEDCGDLQRVSLPQSLKSLGKGAFDSCKVLTDIILPDSLTEISSSLFNNCGVLQKVVIPPTVTKIGDSAFRYCALLKEVDIPDNVTEIGETVFHACTSLESVSLPTALTCLRRRTFEECKSLRSIVIPDSVTKIERCVFESCTSLESVTLPAGLTSIDEDTFNGCTSLCSIVIPDSVTEIWERAFESCTSLESVTLPAGLTSIDKEAFKGCAALHSFMLPDSVTKIGLGAFKGCSAMPDFETSHFKYSAGMLVNKDEGVLMTVSGDPTQSVVPEGIREIEEDAYAGCASLQSVKLPSTLRKIGASAFCGCTSLTDCDIPAGVTEIGEHAFEKCSSLTSVVIPEGVSEIMYSTFSKCTSLESVSLPRALTKLGPSCFGTCEKLSGVTLTDGLAEISRLAFAGCNSLTEIDIPASVTEIGYRAFYGSGLQRVSIANKDTVMDTEVFDDCKSLSEVDLPKGLSWSKVKNRFKNTPWGENPPGKAGEKKAKKAKVEAITNMSLEAITKAAFAPYEARVTVEDKKLTLLATLPNGSFVIGAYDIDKKKDFTQIDQASLQAAKARAEGADDTLVVVGDNNDVYLRCQETGGVKHVVFAGTYSKIAEQALCGMESVETVELPECIETISDLAFSRCRSLREINLPSSLRFIDEQAFAMCTSLTDIDIPDSCTLYSRDKEIFWGCTSLVRVKLPSGLKCIPSSAFSGCTSLREINIPDTVTDISPRAFAKCAALTFDSAHYSLTDCMLVSKDEKKLLDFTRTDATEVTVPEGIEVIGEKAFSYSETLRSVTLAASVRKVEAEAFKNCPALSRVVIGDPYIDIDLSAFAGCTAVTDVDLPAGLTWSKIKNRFKESPWGQTKPAAPAKKAPKAAGASKGKDLRSMSVTAAVKYIFEPYDATVAIDKNEYSWTKPDYYLLVSVQMPGGCLIYGKLGDAAGQAFKDRKFSVADIDIDSLKAIKQRVEQEQLSNTVYQTGNACRKCDITEVVQSAQATQVILTSTVRDSTCKNSDTLESVKIEATGECDYGFTGCTALKRVEIADGVEFIPNGAFTNCTALQDIKLPDSLTAIRARAFEGCSSLSELAIPAGVKEIEYDFINGTAIKRISLPPALEVVRCDAFDGVDLEECEFENEHYKMLDGMLIAKVDNDVVALYAHHLTVKSVTIPDGTKSISSSVFRGCTTLQSVVIPQGVESIGWSVFRNTGLQSVVLPASVKSIGSFAFTDCKSLVKVVIENPGIEIDSDTFSGCDAITEVVLPKGLTWSKIKNRFKDSPWGQTKPAK